MKDKYRVIYQPKGAALEYSHLAVNLFIGCEHGCKYCYAPSCMFKERTEYSQKVTIRKNILDLLEKDCIEMKEAKDDRRVLFCFITDPYQGGDEFTQVTRKALMLMNKYDIPMQVLTKGGMKATSDFDLYKKTDAFAVTLTFLDEGKSLEWEPEAANPIGRIESLKMAKQNGIETWVSFEPIIEPEETYKLFELTKDFVDLYKIGKINNHPAEKLVDWKQFTEKIVKLCEKNGNKYYIKHSLRPYL